MLHFHRFEIAEMIMKVIGNSAVSEAIYQFLLSAVTACVHSALQKSEIRDITTFTVYVMLNSR